MLCFSTITKTNLKLGHESEVGHFKKESDTQTQDSDLVQLRVDKQRSA
jgi:hypothetical protein